MERKLTNEELEAIKAVEELKEEENRHQQLQRELQKIRIDKQNDEKVKKIKYRKFKNKLIKGILITALVSSAVMTIKNKPWLSEDEKLIQQLTFEADIHGGIKDVNSDKYLYDLDEHIESGDCLIQGGGFIPDRIQRVCEKYEISDSVSDALITRFELNCDNKYDAAKKVKPLKIYQEEQRELKKQDNSYGM